MERIFRQFIENHQKSKHCLIRALENRHYSVDASPPGQGKAKNPTMEPSSPTTSYFHTLADTSSWNNLWPAQTQVPMETLPNWPWLWSLTAAHSFSLGVTHICICPHHLQLNPHILRSTTDMADLGGNPSHPYVHPPAPFSGLWSRFLSLLHGGKPTEQN